MAKKTFKQPASFEAASARLDQLVTEMESGNMELDAMINAFEEGRALVAYCNAKLSEVQHRVEEIKGQEADGTLLRNAYNEDEPRNI